MKFAAAVLLGLVSQSEAIKFRPDPVQSPWAAKGSPAKLSKISNGYGPHAVVHDYSVTVDNQYVRHVPEIYSEEKDDRLMNSLIQNYATEGQTDLQPNNKFYLERKHALEAAAEVASTHLGLKGKALDDFVNTHGNKCFDTVDQLNEGFIDIQKGPIFMRYLLDEPEVSNGLQVQLDSQVDLGESDQLRPLNTIQQPWSAKPSAGGGGNAISGAYPANYGGPQEYSRSVPDRFSSESDDLLMKSLISKYALEGKTDGAPNGKFFLDKAAAAAVSSEVVGTHFGFTGEKKEKFLAGRFDPVWNHFDVLGQGFIDVAKGPQFLRQLVDENELANGLQLQMANDINM